MPPEWMLDMQDATLINAISAAMPFGAPSLPALTLEVDGTLTAAMTITGAIRNTGMFTIDWGDGTPEVRTSDTTPMHVYLEADTYEINVRTDAGQVGSEEYDADDL